MPYERVIVAVELAGSVEVLLRRAAAMEDECDAEFNVLAALPERSPHYRIHHKDAEQAEHDALDSAHEQLDALCRSNGITTTRRVVLTGSLDVVTAQEAQPCQIA